MPAIPLHTAVSYVAGAYLVFFALVLIYVAIMASKLSRIETELSELTELAIKERENRAPAPAGGPKTDPAPAGGPQTDPTEAGGPKPEAVAR
jgi:hypothetical protein